MRILKTIVTINIILLISFTLSCTKKPITPEDAFKQAGKAYITNKFDRFVKLLSKDSLKKIKQFIKYYKDMEFEKAKSISKYYNVTPDMLKSLTPESYIALQKLNSKKLGQDPLEQAFKSQIVNIERLNSEAIIHLSNGMSLFFKKEGPFWFFVYE